ncbi:hypothetical protein SCALIN_C13_0054 [Candidatus Scalindua japonica]|uniref:Uncharacterized protein n=1 Tax=Candidatus Scalindua japonica TaxID=1284222 RepID=A0A286TXC7_9BACT|nr:hypothetical protein [Candidatus Scalindua japonica]GAX60543.1 hypothetical protein SCALIN_C13_0054 [Candidatus Scalindua japonica]
MRIFLVGMCDIFLILYLTTLSQVNPFHNSYLTVDDYNKLKESKIQAEQESEKSHAQVLELKNEISALDKEREKAIQSTLYAKAEAKKIRQLVKVEKEKVAKVETKLSKVISEKEEFSKLLLKSRENEEKTQKIVKESQAESEKAREREQQALKSLGQLQVALEKATKQEQHALQIVKNVKTEAEKTKEDKQKALAVAKMLRLKAEEAKKRADEARKREEDALKLAKEARLKEKEARKSEEIARKIAEEERLNAAKASENETIALNLAEQANNQKEIALKKAGIAREAEAKALKIASIAEGETAKVKSKIQSIIQPADSAYSENILDKLVTFTITIGSKGSYKVITMQGIPVKMGDEYVLFTLLDQIGLDPSTSYSNNATYKISVNDKPVTKLFVKPGKVKIAALVISEEIKHCLPIDKASVFTSYMPVLFSLRNHKRLGVMDRIRGVSEDYFVFKRDRLLMITEDELFFDNEGFRGTRNYAEYIVKGDQIVDLSGNFLGLAYKKNKILRIGNLKEWHLISIHGMRAKQLANRIYNINKL